MILGIKWYNSFSTNESGYPFCKLWGLVKGKFIIWEHTENYIEHQQRVFLTIITIQSQLTDSL